MANKVILRGKGWKEEGTLDAAASPGMFCSLSADGKYDPGHGGADGADIECLILEEDALQGKTLDQAYSSGDRGFFHIPIPGDVCNLLVTDGESIAVGDILIEDASTGLWIEAAGTEAKLKFKALEAAAPSGANGFCKCRCM